MYGEVSADGRSMRRPVAVVCEHQQRAGPAMAVVCAMYCASASDTAGVEGDRDVGASGPLDGAPAVEPPLSASDDLRASS